MTSRRAATAAGLLLAAALIAAGSASAAAPSAAEKLVDRYAPILELKVDDDLPCSTSGEQYSPMSVETALSGMTLVRFDKQGKPKRVVVRKSPTVTDIAGLGTSTSGDVEYYLDQPGKPARPGCAYARDSQRLTRGERPVVYAHISREYGRRSLALQYWFYYWFNHFNDLHESDWEMIQLAFDADSIPGALARGPSRVAYAQHRGGEVADWDDAKLQKDGTHPVVYAASGSHSSQYESALYLGSGRHGTGLGCDDTRGPSRAVRPVPVLVASPASRAAAWLTYGGLWGEKAKGFTNGIHGPAETGKWTEPLSWMDGLRTSTPKVPISQSAAVTATHFFCQAIIKIAAASNYVGGNIWVLALLVLALAAAVVVPLRRTRWRPVETEPLAGERATGQLLRAAGRLYRRRAPPMVGLAVIVAGLTAAIVYVERLLADRTVLPLDLAFADPRLDNLAGVVVAAPAYPLVLVLVGSPFVVLLRRIDAGEPAGIWPTIREVVPLLPRLLLLGLIAIVGLLLLAVTVIGLPVAVKKAVDWTFGAQEVVFHDRRARAALAESTRRVRGRWRAVAAVDVALFFVGALLGPLVGSVLIVFTDLSLSTINAVGVAIFAIALPYMATALTLLYLDPRTQAEVLPGAWSRWLAGVVRRERSLAGARLVRMPR